MFKGEPGTRKSTSALSFPRPQYWFSWDQKMRAMLLPMQAWGIKPQEIQYDDYSDFNKARTKLEQLQGNCPFKTIIIDSITSAADSTLRQTMQLKYGKTKASGAAAGKVVAGIAVNELEDYNAESSALSEILALTKDIHQFHKVNVILIAHVIQAEYKSVGGDSHFSRTIVTAGKRIAAKIPAYCEEVYHFDKGNDASPYCCYTQHTGDDFARTSLPLDKKLVFENRPLYTDFIVPSMERFKNDLTKLLPTIPPPNIQTNKPNPNITQG
jgi:hypothetical protein